MNSFFSRRILAEVSPSTKAVIARLPIILGLAAGIFCIAPAQAESTTTTVFSQPAQYCFNQGDFSKDLRRTTLSYNLVIPPADQFKPGDIYVGFRQRSVPDVLWLPGSLTWSKYDPQNEIVPYRSAIYGLQPVTALNMVQDPIDLTSLMGDGEVLVGYGLRATTGATPKDSFQDMVDNKRFSVIWVVGSGEYYGNPPDPYVTMVRNFSGKVICLKATEMLQETVLHF